MPKDKFAVKEIRKYYEHGSSAKYFKCIDQTLLNLENGVKGFDDLKSDYELENRIIKTLLSVFLDKLELEDSNSGVLGVSKTFFSDGVSWCYKDPIKKEFVFTEMLYANSLPNLKDKVKENKGIWYIFDLKKLKNVQTPPRRAKVKRKSRNKHPKEDINRKIMKKLKDDKFIKSLETDRKKDKKWSDLEKEIGLYKKSDRYSNLDKMFR